MRDIAVTPRAWAGFAMMCVGMFMAILDVQIVATSLPTIQVALDITPSAMSWVQTAYLIAEVIAIPLTGLLTRALTMRWLFVVAILEFTAASVGCAASGNLGILILWRLVQGLSGGTLIPVVFAAVFMLFPARRQDAATALAGGLAVLAPTLGPVVGGWVTATYSWRWLFLINVIPGLVAAIAAAHLLPRDRAQPEAFDRFDTGSLVMMATSLGALQVALKQAPQDGWSSPLILGLLAATLIAGLGFVHRTSHAVMPMVALRRFGDRNFAIGCLLSFVFGIGLFGSVYMMPVFLAYARGHDPLEIGRIMLVTGVAQLAATPMVLALERRWGARPTTALGFLLFAIGLGLSAGQTIATDFEAMVWPQLIRGVGIMFCLLPPTRLALGHIARGEVADASGLYNLMRNLGGAVGIAVIDTVVYGRMPAIGEDIIGRLQAGDPAAARLIGLSPSLFALRKSAALDPKMQAALAASVRKAALVVSLNEAWGTVAIVTALALLVIPFTRILEPASGTGRS